MSTIDRAALIEQAARAVVADQYDPAPSLDDAYVDAAASVVTSALPVIAKALLAPLRELHPSVPGTFTPWGGKTRDVTLCRCSGAVARACPTRDLLDVIEAEVTL